MKHYIERETGTIFAYELDGSQDAYIQEHFELLTEEELAVLRAVDMSIPDERWWRDNELSRADIQLLKVQDGATGLGTQKAWREYRNSLRSWPEDVKFPDPSFRPKAPDSAV